MPAPTVDSGTTVDAPARLAPEELTFVHWLRGGPVSDERLAAAADEFSRRALAGEGRHFGVYADHARESMGLRVPGPVTLNDWDRAMLSFLADKPDPSEAIVQLALSRDPHVLSHEELSQLYHQWSVGLFTPGRVGCLLENLQPYINLSGLEGATVADIGGGPGQLARSLVDLVGPRGRTIVVDVDPRVDDWIPYAVRVDPLFGRIEFRFVSKGSPDPGVRPEDHLAMAFLVEVHILGDRLDSPWEAEKWQLDWLERVFAALRPGGKLVVCEGGGAAPPLERVLPVFEKTSFAGKVTGHDFFHQNANEPEARKGYVIVATR